MHIAWKLQFKCKGEKEGRNEHLILYVLAIISQYGKTKEDSYSFQAFCVTACKPNPG